jgi:rubredoxin
MAGEQPKFERLPADCTCDGEALVLLRHYPRLGFMPELMAWRCSVCGHVETIEVIQPDAQKVA